MSNGFRLSEPNFILGFRFVGLREDEDNGFEWVKMLPFRRSSFHDHFSLLLEMFFFF